MLSDSSANSSECTERPGSLAAVDVASTVFDASIMSHMTCSTNYKQRVRLVVE